MKKNLVFVVTALLLGATAIWSGCGKTETAMQVKPAIDKEQAVVYLGTRSEPQMGFDPMKGYNNADGNSIFHSNLVKTNSDLSFEKDLAEDYKISEDGLTYTFILREGIKCHDGVPFTTADVKFSFEKAKENPRISNLDVIKEIEIKNEREIIFHLKQPNSLFMYTVARLPLVPEHAYGEGYGQQPIGTGPYKFVSWEKGQQMIAEANENYYKGKPKLNKLTFLFINSEAAFQAAKAGKIDVYGVPYNYVNVPIDGTELVSLKSVGKWVVMLPVLKPGEATHPDNKPVGNPVTSDIAVRKALNYGIDRNAIVQSIMHGHGSPAYECVDSELPYYNPDIAYKDNDVEMAKKLLADAGWVDTNGNGIVDKAGQEAEVTIVVNAGDKLLQSVAMLLSDQAKRFGVGIKVDPKSAAEMNTRQHKDLKLVNYGSLDPMNIFYLYYGPNAGKGFYNMSYFNNPSVNSYIEQAMTAPNEAQANDFWKKAQWDGNTGFSVKGDPSIIWLANKDYMYQVKKGFTIGKQLPLQPGSMDASITRNIETWQWL